MSETQGSRPIARSDIDADVARGSALALGLLRTTRGAEPLLLVGRDQAETSEVLAGAVDVYRGALRQDRDRAASEDWRLETTLTAATPEPGAEFGASIAVATGDPSIAIVGAPRSDVLGHFDAGSVEVFRRDIVPRNGSAFDPRPVRPPGISTQRRPSPRGSGDARGKTAGNAAGNTDDEAIDIRWRRVASIRSPEPQSSGWFGRSVATDGTWLAIGEPGADVTIEGATVFSAGTVHLYRVGSSAIVPIATLAAPTPSQSMWFGSAVAIDDGRLLVGAPGSEIPSDLPQGDEGVRAGRAFLYEIMAIVEGFSDAPIVLDPPAAEAGAGFGQSVALTRGYAVIG
ncbi:MAG: hypothetical protein ACKO3W_04925, partial [bacterium]